MSTKTTTKKPRRRRAPGAGRPEIPPALRRVTLSVRVLPHIKAGFIARARAHGRNPNGSARSSVGAEVERAYEASRPGRDEP